MDGGSGRWPTQWCESGHRPLLSLGTGLALILVGVGSAAAGMVAEELYRKASSSGSVRVIVQLRGKTLPEGQISGAEQPAPAPGPGPISPGSGPQIPPEDLPPTEKGTEVPIGRLEGYEEEKRKALEIPFRGRPPGAIQEDPAVPRRGAELNPCEGR